MTKLLIVDDEPDLLHGLRGALEATGYTVLMAADGVTAVEMARRELPALILLDLMLPKLDGYRVLKLLKADERYREIPVLVITARADAQDLTLALECGATGCLVKPLKVEAVLNQIRAITGNGHGPSEGCAS